MTEAQLNTRNNETENSITVMRDDYLSIERRRFRI